MLMLMLCRSSYARLTPKVLQSKWLKAMEDEMKSMNANKVWDMEIISKGAKTVGCKWVYKTKLDSQGNIERYKA